MELNFLDKSGVKDLGNALKYLDDPDLIENPSHKTRLSKEENRKDIITNSFKNLTDRDKRLLITYLANREKEAKEVIDAFAEFKDLENGDGIAEFLHKLMISIENKQLKLDLFKVLYLNVPSYSLKAIYEMESEEYREELCRISAILNPERGYIYGLLNDIELPKTQLLDVRELIYEVNQIQRFEDKPILEMVLIDYKEPGGLIDEINNRLKYRDFNMFYTLALNLDILDQYNIDADREDLMLLKWAIHIPSTKEEENFISEVSSKDLSLYSTEWLTFVSMELLNINAKNQRISIMLLDYIISDRKLTSATTADIAGRISMHIKDKTANRYHLFETLKKLNTTTDIYNILDFADTEELNLVKDRSFESYISKKIKHTQEFCWIEALENSPDYIEPQSELSPNALIFALREKSPKANYNILRKIEENNEELYLEVMKGLTGLIANKLDGDRKYTTLMIALDYQCEDKTILKEIQEYEDENHMIIRAFIELCNPSLLARRYVEEIKSAIKSREDQRIIELLVDIKEPQPKRECSELVFDSYIDDNLHRLIDIWEYLSLGIQRKIDLNQRVLEMLDTGQLELTEENIGFANELGLDPVILYNSIEDESGERYLLNIWYESNEIGKIIDVLRERALNEVQCLEDIREIQSLLEEYNIDDRSLSTLIQIKAYTFISLELLELDIESEKTFYRLNTLATQLRLYGLIDRFLTDGLLQVELDERLINYLFKRLISIADSEDMWTYYWHNILDDLNSHRYKSYNIKMGIFLNHLTKSKEGIEWFLETLDSTNIDRDIYIAILENLLILSNKQNRIILQSEQELDHMHSKTLTEIGLSIGRALGNMERTIMSRSEDVGNDILIENLKSFRRALKEIGIEPVEDIDNYGREVELDRDIHEDIHLENMDKGVVDSLGIKIDDEDIMLSTLLKID